MDFYIVLGHRSRRVARRREAGLSPAGAAVPSRRQPGRWRRGGTLPRDRAGLRDPGRSRSPAPVRRGGCRSRRTRTSRRPDSRGSISRRRCTRCSSRPSATCLPRSSAADEARGGPERGADLHQTLSLSFAQAMAGGEHRLALMRQENCARCAGTGQASIAAARCPACEGDGVVRSARGHMVFTRPCGRCARQRAAVAAGVSRTAAGLARCGAATSSSCPCRPASPTGRACAWPRGAMPGRRAARRGTSTSPSASRSIRCSAARATTCT